MRFDRLPNSYSAPDGAGRALRNWLWLRHAPAGLVFSLLFSLLFMALSLAAAPGCAAQNAQTVAAQTPQSPSNGSRLPSEVARPSKMQPADSARKKQISDESTQLLALALSLKQEVDKTNKDTLSLKVIRKADEIERLAKTVKEKTRSGSGGI